MRHLTGYEKETIVNFNEAEDIASIFTYNPAWQKHLEQRLGLKPTTDNGFGGREYQLPKNRIRLPSLKRQYSEAAKSAMRDHLVAIRRKRQPQPL